jgi:hypothetical protein
MGYRDCEPSEIGAPRSIEAAELLTSRDKSDARRIALLKLSQNSDRVSIDFARNALGVRMRPRVAFGSINAAVM